MKQKGKRRVKGKKVKQNAFFKLSGDKLERMRKNCPRCGDGTVMAEHNDRWYCGKCLYTEWKKSNK
jgi:small subunit ribosomal protein S27Ae